MELFRPDPVPGGGGGAPPSAARPLPWRAPAGGTWRCARPFLGEHQVKKRRHRPEGAGGAGQDRGWPVHSPQAVAAGFEKAFIPARMEVISQQRPWCCWTAATTPAAPRRCARPWRSSSPSGKWPSMGVMADKDSRGELQVLGPLFSQIVTVAPEGHRAMTRPAAGPDCPGVLPQGGPRGLLPGGPGGGRPGHDRRTAP